MLKKQDADTLLNFLETGPWFPYILFFVYTYSEADDCFNEGENEYCFAY